MALSIKSYRNKSANIMTIFFIYLFYFLARISMLKGRNHRMIDHSTMTDEKRHLRTHLDIYDATPRRHFLVSGRKKGPIKSFSISRRSAIEKVWRVTFIYGIFYAFPCRLRQRVIEMGLIDFSVVAFACQVFGNTGWISKHDSFLFHRSSKVSARLVRKTHAEGGGIVSGRSFMDLASVCLFGCGWVLTGHWIVWICG